MNFKSEVLEKSFEKPILVDFWASWCPPCRILGPVIEKLAEEQSEQWELVKVATEAHQALALFQLLGNDHPLAKAYRWKFDMVLY